MDQQCGAHEKKMVSGSSLEEKHVLILPLTTDPLARIGSIAFQTGVILALADQTCIKVCGAFKNQSDSWFGVTKFQIDITLEPPESKINPQAPVTIRSFDFRVHFLFT